MKTVDPTKVIRIEMIEAPQAYEKGDGDYEVRLGSNPDEVLYHDMFSLERWLKTIWPSRVNDILDSLHNFRLCYIAMHDNRPWELTT